jgi:hypothetical protein
MLAVSLKPVLMPLAGRLTMAAGCWSGFLNAADHPLWRCKRQKTPHRNVHEATEQVRDAKQSEGQRQHTGHGSARAGNRQHTFQAAVWPGVWSACVVLNGRSSADHPLWQCSGKTPPPRGTYAQATGEWDKAARATIQHTGHRQRTNGCSPSNIPFRRRSVASDLPRCGAGLGTCMLPDHPLWRSGDRRRTEKKTYAQATGEGEVAKHVRTAINWTRQRTSRYTSAAYLQAAVMASESPRGGCWSELPPCTGHPLWQCKLTRHRTEANHKSR